MFFSTRRGLVLGGERTSRQNLAGDDRKADGRPNSFGFALRSWSLFWVAFAALHAPGQDTATCASLIAPMAAIYVGLGAAIVAARRYVRKYRVTD
jgi:hypothetical protein